MGKVTAISKSNGYTNGYNQQSTQWVLNEIIIKMEQNIKVVHHHRHHHRHHHINVYYK